MGVGEGGPELVKQLLKNTWDITPPEVVLCYVTGKPKKGIGPHDVAIALVKETFGQGLVKNKVLEFAGPGLEYLPYDFRSGIDVMTTETTCLSSIWATDEEIKKYYEIHKRPECYKKLEPKEGAYYDAIITIELDKMEAMIALPRYTSSSRMPMRSLPVLRQKPQRSSLRHISTSGRRSAKRAFCPTRV